MQDQYINHIMNETGARVILRGHGSGNTESLCVEGTTFASCNLTLMWSAIVCCVLITVIYSLWLFLAGGQQQQLHLFLSSNNPKSLEDAKCLAENLLDTISVECGISR